MTNTTTRATVGKGLSGGRQTYGGRQEFSPCRRGARHSTSGGRARRAHRQWPDDGHLWLLDTEARSARVRHIRPAAPINTNTPARADAGAANFKHVWFVLVGSLTRVGVGAACASTAFLAFAAGDPKLVARRPSGKKHPASPRASFKSPSWLSNPTRRARQIGARSLAAYRTFSGDGNDGQSTLVSHHHCSSAQIAVIQRQKKRKSQPNVVGSFEKGADSARECRPSCVYKQG